MQLEFKWRKIKCGRRPEADNGNCNYVQFELVSTGMNVCFWRFEPIFLKQILKFTVDRRDSSVLVIA